MERRLVGARPARRVCGCPKSCRGWSGGAFADGSRDANASCLVSAHDHILGPNRLEQVLDTDLWATSTDKPQQRSSAHSAAAPDGCLCLCRVDVGAELSELVQDVVVAAF